MVPTASEKAERTQTWEALNNDLRLSTFIVGFRFTLADAVMYDLILRVLPDGAQGVAEASLFDGLGNVGRWLRLVRQHLGEEVEDMPKQFYDKIFVPFSEVQQRVASQTMTDGKPLVPQSVLDLIGGTGAADQNKPQQQQQKSKGNNNNNNNNNKNNQKKGKKNKGKKQAQPKQAAKGAAAASEPIAEVDIRVGHINKAWEHPASDKLWCEEIDCGEEKPRQILSGLRHNFTQEQMTNRKVLVVCDLKPAKLGGILSQGMVLCASNDDHSEVEFLTPPADAKVG